MHTNLDKTHDFNFFESIQIINSWLSIKSKKNIFKLTFFSICVGLLEVTSLSSITPILNLFNSKNQFENLLFINSNSNWALLMLAIFFGLFLCVVSFFKMKTISYGNFLSARIGHEIGQKLLTNFLGQELLKHKTKESTSVINIFTIHLNQTVKFIVFFLQLIVAFFSTICIFTFLVIQNPIVILGTFISISLIYFFLAVVNKKKISKASSKVKIGIDNTAKLIQEICLNTEKYILEYKDKKTLERFSEYDTMVRFNNAKSRNYTVLPRYMIEAAAISSFVFFSMLSAILLKIDNVTLLAKLSVSVFGIQKLLPSINLIYQSWNQMSFSVKSVVSVKDLFSDKIDSNRLKFNNKNKAHFKETINLKNICFGYENKNFVISSFNLRINKGDRILIRGKSGSGKTTLINIICSLIKPSEGDVYIDNKLLGDQINYSEWRKQIGIVKQKPYIKSGKIVDLILGQNLQKDINQSIRDAKYYAKLACIDDVINTFPEGYLHYIREDGKSLSGGQMQRIAIANALSLKPSLLILDESTSGVDKQTEKKIFNNIFKIKDITILSISHSKNLENIFKNHINL